MSASAASVGARLESAIGAAHVFAQPEQCREYAVDEFIPSVVAKPSSAEEAAEIVRFAAAEKLALIPCGNRSKLGIGMPPSRYDIALDMTGLNQIAHYDPGDLTLSVDAGSSFNDFAVPLYKQKQFLPLGVPYYFESTIGGIIASGVDSALRHSYGTARDFLIGAEFVNGTGAITKSGGRVVKNVTGYDLHKLLIGSLGTLAVITRLNFRTFPMPPADVGLVASFQSIKMALALLRRIVESQLSPSSLELLSPQLMRLFLGAEKHEASEPPAATLEGRLAENSWHVCVSAEGTAEVCARYERDITKLATESGATDVQVLGGSEKEDADLWHYIGQAAAILLGASPSAAIFKIAQLPNRLETLFTQLSAIAGRFALPSALMARGSGTLYFALLPQTNIADALHCLSEAASAIFQFCAREGACATLPWCPTALKRTTNIWGIHSSGIPVGRPDFALMRRVKSAFDPYNIFAPGRFLTGS